MRLQFRAATPTDVATLVEIYDRHYHGGYSACFDRYGPATPQDFWWVQSEKAVTLVELNQRPLGLVIIGRSGRRLLAEEVLLGAVSGDQHTTLRQVHDFLVQRFRQGRQEVLTMRCVETNAAALGIARSFGFAFTNVLVVAIGGAAPAATADGYRLRRAAPADAPDLARLYEEATGHPLRGKELAALWRSPEVRVVLAERERYPVGFAIAQVRDGAGRWTIGVREAHRGKGIGRALAQQALQFCQAKRVPAVTTYWGTDAAAVRFIRALGTRTERTYLYFEQPL